MPGWDCDYYFLDFCSGRCWMSDEWEECWKTAVLIADSHQLTDQNHVESAKAENVALQLQFSHGRSVPYYGMLDYVLID